MIVDQAKTIALTIVWSLSQELSCVQWSKLSQLLVRAVTLVLKTVPFIRSIC